MKRFMGIKRVICILLTGLMASVLLSCSGTDPLRFPEPEKTQPESETAGYLVTVEDEPDTVDFQCTSSYYTIAQNAFNRLVEMENDENGNVTICPSLAESWDVSEDGCRYTFHLRQGVRFSNGASLASDDVQYTLIRLLTHPRSCNRDIAASILGAPELMNGEAEDLKGFEIINDREFVITLLEPFQAFPACLTMPGASILDRETTEAAGDRFGLDPDCTIGTGPFVLKSWKPGIGMLLEANPDCWEGPPACRGLDLRFMSDSEDVRQLFENGELDILDLDELGDLAEYFIRGDIYQDQLQVVQQIGITYIALNESVKPLNDVKVRRAMQLALNRRMLLDAVYAGRGSIENGIFSRGLHGYNPDLPEIPYDPEAAKELLAEAGYPNGFHLTLSFRSSLTPWAMSLLHMAADLWKRIGIQTSVEVMSEEEFLTRRQEGKLACYDATWTADYNDPDNYIYTFFGSEQNSRFRSLCYTDEDIMLRVRNARSIPDESERIREYQELEKKIVQEDAAWIPLFSRLRYYVVREGVQGFHAAWNGSVKANYKDISVPDREVYKEF